MNKPTIKSRRSSRQRGFTLLEMTIAISLMSLLILGAMDMILNSSRATIRTQAQIFAASDAANSMQKVIAQLREANSFSLPHDTTPAAAPETNWVLPTGTTQTQFSTTLSGEIINTAIEIKAPSALTPAANNYPAGVAAIQVQNVAGSNHWAITPYDAQANGAAVTLIYRGDPDGTPDPDPTGSGVTGAGTYLWQYTIPADNSFNVVANPPVALCKSVSVAPNAVQFVRPSYSSIPEQFQVEIKIISGYYSPINGAQTNEEGNGASSSQLTGKCVFMRDHNTAGTPGTATARSSNNVFQYH